MPGVKRAMLMTLREAEDATFRARQEGRYEDAITLKDLVSLYAEASIWQNNERMILENPRSASTKPAYIQVRQMIEDLSFQAVPEDLRKTIAEMEAKLQGRD